MVKMSRYSFWAVLLLVSGCAAFAPQVDPPYVSLADLRITNIGLFEQRYGLQLRIQNPNPSELPISGMDFRVTFNDVEFGRGVSHQSVTVPAYGEALLNVDMVSNVSRLIDQLKEVELGRSEGMRYRITGGLSLNHRTGKIPFEYRGEIGGKKR